MILQARNAATAEIATSRRIFEELILPKPKVGSSSLSRAITQCETMEEEAVRTP
jgi:hypothetical protein